MLRIKWTEKTWSIFPIMICLLLLAILAKEALSSEDKHMKYGINATVTKYEPAVALRASGCLTCHAEIASNYITDVRCTDY